MVGTAAGQNAGQRKHMEEITRKGIVLAGGKNSRLYPITHAVPKSLLPIYDKPLIYYSLSILMLANIRDILIITTPEGESPHRELLGDGDQFGVHFSYLAQSRPRGIADAFVIGKDFVAEHPSALILSDNLFYGSSLINNLRTAAKQTTGATVFAYPVPDPQRFGVVGFDKSGQAQSLEEKPSNPQSPYAVTGCYFYDKYACQYAESLSPSGRDELEITDLNRVYLNHKTLTVQQLGRGAAWFDTGTPDSLSEAAEFIRVIQKQQGLMIACLEEIARRQGWIDKQKLVAQAKRLDNTPYGNYLRQLIANT